MKTTQIFLAAIFLSIFPPHLLLTRPIPHAFSVLADSVRQVWSISMPQGYTPNDSVYYFARQVYTDIHGNIYLIAVMMDGIMSQHPFLSKISPAGEIKWTVQWPQIGQGEVIDQAVDRFGNTFILANVFLPNVGAKLLLVKCDSAGSVAWRAEYYPPNTAANYPVQMILDHAGNPVVASRTFAIPDSAQGRLLKFNGASGALLWTFTVPGYIAAPERSNRLLAVDAFDNIAFSSASDYPNHTGYVQKINSESKLLWRDQLDWLSTLTMDDSGNVIAAIIERDTVKLVKWSSAGTKEWAVPYSGRVPPVIIGDYQDFLLDRIVTDSRGNVYLAWNSRLGAALEKFDGGGRHLWETVYNYSGDTTYPRDWATGFTTDRMDNVYLLAVTEDLNSRVDFVTVKHNPAGKRMWAIRYHDPEIRGNGATDLVVDNDNVYVLTTSYLDTGSFVTLVKYSQWSTLDVRSNTQTMPKSFELTQNYPNPFNPTTQIRYGVPERSFVRIDIHNMLGQLVTELAKGMEEPGFKTVSWDASGLPSGLYYARMQAGRFSAVKKLLLLR